MSTVNLIKYCFFILLTVALSTFLFNLISNPGEYLAKLDNYQFIRRDASQRLYNGTSRIIYVQLSNGVFPFKISN